MTITKDFQEDVARKLTTVFDTIIENAKTGPIWEQLKVVRELDMQDYRQIRNYEELLIHYQVPDMDSDAKHLFMVQRFVEAEIQNIDTLLARGRKRPRLEKLIECISEPSTRYYENDGLFIEEYRPGRPIYSPIVDVAISPSVKVRRNQKSQSIGIYPLMNGPMIFDALSRLSLIRQLKDALQQNAIQNFNNAGVEYYQQNINIRPLCLFAFEIENQTNKKHMMGDFLNSLMLAKYPVVIVPQEQLTRCLNLIKLARVISEIKQVNVYSLLREVMVVSIPQFRETVNGILEANNIQRLGLENFR